jgi:NitT/TauT family transport system ATP-binding protein
MPRPANCSWRISWRCGALYVTHNLSEALRLADRVAILSRRPGRLRDIVAIDIPQAERAGVAAQARLAALHEQLWALIKAEAQIAEREVVHG